MNSPPLGCELRGWRGGEESLYRVGRDSQSLIPCAIQSEEEWWRGEGRESTNTWAKGGLTNDGEGGNQQKPYLRKTRRSLE